MSSPSAAVSLRARAVRRLTEPWSAPQGIPGRLAGIEMARGKQRLNAEVVASLEPRAGDAILEVGFGPGVTIEHLAHAVPGLALTGVDPSPVMLRQASRRNRTTCASGQVTLIQAPAERLPFGEAQFDKAVTLNSIGHWQSVTEGLAELHRVLRPGGRLVVGSRAGHESRRLAALRDALRSAGFRSARVEERRAVTLVVATS